MEIRLYFSPVPGISTKYYFYYRRETANMLPQMFKEKTFPTIFF
jgi:hypothetical protein